MTTRLLLPDDPTATYRRAIWGVRENSNEIKGFGLPKNPCDSFCDRRSIRNVMGHSGMKYNKLVRDKIIEIIESKGEKAVFHIADEQEYQEKLKEKLQEEVDEFMRDSNMDELADIMEIIDAICAFKNFNMIELEKIKNKKSEDRGRFEKRIILDES